MKVIVIDSHPLLRKGLSIQLSEDFPRASLAEAPDLSAALDLLGEKRFDLVISEVNTNGRQNDQLVNSIRDLQPGIPILILSAADENIYAIPFITAGASGYISKQATNEEMATAIRCVLKGNKYISPSIHTQLIKQMDQNNRMNNPNPIFKLSKKEKLIMDMVIKGKTNKEISYDLQLKNNTVSTFKKRILNKMEVTSSLSLKIKAELLYKLAQSHN